MNFAIYLHQFCRFILLHFVEFFVIHFAIYLKRKFSNFSKNLFFKNTTPPITKHFENFPRGFQRTTIGIPQISASLQRGEIKRWQDIKKLVTEIIVLDLDDLWLAPRIQTIPTFIRPRRRHPKPGFICRLSMITAPNLNWI